MRGAAKLHQREEQPEVIRKLLGEIENTNFNYVNTMHRLTGYVADIVRKFGERNIHTEIVTNGDRLKPKLISLMQSFIIWKLDFILLTDCKV